MIGGFLASWYNCRKAGIPLLRWADVAAPSVVLGTAITRIGCLLFGCDYGKRSDAAPGPSASRQDSPAWKDHVNNFQLPRTRPGVVPGPPHAALRDAGRPVPVRAADVPAAGAQVLGHAVPGLGDRLRHLAADHRGLPGRRPAGQRRPAVDLAVHRPGLGGAGGGAAGGPAPPLPAGSRSRCACGSSRWRVEAPRPAARAARADGRGPRSLLGRWYKSEARRRRKS